MTLSEPPAGPAFLDPPQIAPSSHRISDAQAYAVAIVSTGATLLVRLSIDESLRGQPMLSIFTIPIMLSAYVGGWKSGLLATFLSCLGASYYLLPPLNYFGLASGVERWQQFFLLLAGVIISALNEALHGARRRADDAVRAHQRAEAQARSEKQFSDTMLETMPGILYLFNDEGRFLRWNRPLEAITGYSAAEVAGMHPQDFFAAEAQPSIEAAIRLSLEKGVSTVEAPLLARDGTATPYLFTANRTVFAGMPCVVGVGLDVSERKQAEIALREAHDELESRVERRTALLAQSNAELAAEILERERAEAEARRSREELQSFIDAMSTLAAKIAPDGTFLIVNKVAIDASGLTTDEYMRTNFLAGPWWSFDAGVQRRVHAAFHEALAGKIVNYDERVFVFGGVRTINFGLIPVWDEAGTVTCVIAEGRDITELKLAEAELVAARETADAANLAKSEFLSRMSHELRTPLNAILGFGQILEKQPLSGIATESVGHILKGGRHLLDLINEVLDIARVESGRVELSLEPVALYEVVPEACALVRPLAAEQEIKLTYDADRGYSGHVLADRQRLKQVLINLLSNAIKYNRPGGSVHVSCCPASDEWTCVIVRDTGPGIAPQDLKKLFAPFERLNADGSNIEGTGLGLVLSERLVAAMGGRLAVESTVGEGTSFTVDLPPAKCPADALEPQTNSIAAPEPAREVQKCWTVLCVEDNPSNLRLLEVILLGRPDINLLTAIQGSIGLELARQHAPHLILLDLNLPDMHGRDVLDKLQGSADTRDIPVIIVTADATTGQIRRLLSAGARSYLTKPLDVDLFLATLDEYLCHRAVSDDPVGTGKENLN